MSNATTSDSALPPSTRLRNGRPSGPPVFLLALLLGGSLHFGVLMLFHFTVVPAAPGHAHSPTPYIHFNPDSPALQTLVTQAQFSPEQIYLSSEKSFSAQALPRATAPLHPVFDSITVQPASTEVDFNQPDHATPMAAGPSDALKPTQWDLLSNIGQAPTPDTKLTARGALVRITRLETLDQPNSPVIELTWPPNLAPPTGNGNWQPVSFLLRFNASGLAGEPVLEPGFDTLSQSNSPSDADVNKFLREKLRDWYTTQHPPLPPGLYDAVVGP